MLESLICPVSAQEVPLSEAPLYFEDKGIAPAEAVAFYIRSERPGILPLSPFEYLPIEPVHGDKTFSSSLSPSSCSPNSVCLREVAISRALPFSSAPASGWMANEGTALWTSLKRAGAMSPPYEYEVTVGQPDKIEILKGWFVRGTIDRLRRDEKGKVVEIFDIKTKRFLKTDRGLESDWQLQMNCYARLLRNSGQTADGQLPKMFIWRIYRGAADASTVFRKLFVPPLDDLQLEGRIGNFVRSSEAKLAEIFAGTDDLSDLRERVNRLPMDGEIKQMFNGKKCSKYCRVMDLCYDLAGKSF